MTCYNSELPIGPQGPTGPQGPQGPAGVLAYKVYTALLTQVNDDAPAAPTAIVLENTIGNIVWTRQGAGEYTATLLNSFLNNKTLCLAYGNTQDSQGAVIQYYFERSDDSNIILQTGAVGENGDGLITNIPFEIRVYN